MKEFDYDIISRYVDEEMSPAERMDFEQQMQREPELRKQVELYFEVTKSLQRRLHPAKEEAELRRTLEQLRPQYFQTRSRVVPMAPRKKWLMAVAATVVFLLALTIWAPWNPDLYRKYSDVRMPGIEERGAEEDSLLRQAEKEFNEKRFAESIPLFETYLAAEPDDAFVRFYYGIALMQSGQTGKSRREFDTLFTGNSAFRYEAAFFMALSYLKEKDRDRCREWLQRIPPDAPNYPKAQELLRKV